MSKDFCSLHTHSSYSNLDGMSKIPELVSRAKELGMSSLGISDHGAMHGVIDFYKECKKQGIKPVLGIEAYAADDRLERSKIKPQGYDTLDGSNKYYYHLSVYARNNVGFQNLMKLSSDAYINGQYMKPRTDWEMLSTLGDGLIVGSGCLGGPVLQPLLHDNYQGALEAAGTLQDCVGKDNFFIELMNHGLPEQYKTNPQLLQIARDIGARPYLSQDTHYTHGDDAHGHEGLLCVSTATTLADPKRFKFHNHEYYLKSPDQMYELAADRPDLCTNTLVIAEMCNVDITFGEMHLPVFDYPEGFESAHAYLEHLVYSKVKERYPEPSSEVMERIAYELSVFEAMKVSSYPLIVWDVIQFCRRAGIKSGPGRGSSGASILFYILGITQIDPLFFDLPFERFLNPSRVTMPDADLDFEQGRRQEVINYTIEKYGQDSVSMIATYGKIKARTAVRDAGRVLGYEYKVADKISKLMPPLISGFDTSLEECFEESPKNTAGYAAAAELRELYDRDLDTKKIVDLARQLEGQIRSYGVHACGVLVTPGRVDDYAPLYVTKDGVVSTQWDKKTVEDLGLLKMDYLGLKNLDVISMSERLIGNGFLVEDLPLDDVETYKLLSRGDAIGCFQVESSGMRSLLKHMKPDSIHDISACLALYRPGPMAQDWHTLYADRKHGRKPTEYFHIDAFDVLKGTWGLPIYQEQIMGLSRVFAGYDMASSDNLRRIIGRKIKKDMEAEEGRFVDGCINNGYTEEVARKLFSDMEGFSAYGFSSVHAYSYSFITYWTAYLKTHYPKEYMASLLTYSMDDLDKTALYVGEARKLGLKIYPPDVNSSELGYTVEEDGIRIGLGTLKGLGADTTREMVRIRKEQGFDSLYDFAYKVNPKAPALKSLAYGGALDAWGKRQAIAHVASDLLAQTRKDRKKADTLTLFDVMEYSDFTIPDFEFSWHEMLEKEKEVLGIYASGHPLEDYLELITNDTIADVKESKENAYKEYAVVVSSIETKRTKSGNSMAFVEVEDLTGALQLICFQKTLDDFGHLLVPGSILKIKTRTSWDSYREEQSYHLVDAEPVAMKIGAVAKEAKQRFGIHVPRGFFNKDMNVVSLRQILSKYGGTVPVDIYVSRTTKRDIGFDMGVEVCDNMIMEIKELFKNAIK